jgi:hypothetical protein
VVRTLDECVIQHEEKRCHVVRDLGSPKELLADVTDVAQFWMFEAVPPEHEGSVKDDRGSG